MACDPVDSYLSRPPAEPYDEGRIHYRRGDVVTDLCPRIDDLYRLIPSRARTSDSTPFQIPSLFEKRTTVQAAPLKTWSMAQLWDDLLRLKGIENFELRAKIRLPIVDIKNDIQIVQSITEARIGGQGAVIALGIEFKPHLGPIPLQKTANKIPLLGPFFRIKILRLFMDSTTRHLKTQVEYLIFPIKRDIHQDLVKGIGLSGTLLRGDSYDLTKGIPSHIWQIVELVQRLVKEKGDAGIQKLIEVAGLERMIPLFEEGEISIQGNFANEIIRLSGLNIQFAPVSKGQTDRLTVSGNLLKPVIKVWGLKGFEIDHPRALLRVVNDDPLTTLQSKPLEIHGRIDPYGRKPLSFTIPHYQTSRAFIETEPRDESNLKFRLTLEEGLEFRNFEVALGHHSPLFAVERLVAKRTFFEGFGLRLQTTPGGQAIFERSALRLVEGRPRFTSRITGRSTGEVRLSSGREEIGFLKFDSLEGTGDLVVGYDPQGRERVEILGNIKASFPELRLMVRFHNIRAFVQTTISQASLQGHGKLVVMPMVRIASLKSSSPQIPLRIQGQSGEVIFHQNLSEMMEWPELKSQLGPLSRRVTTDLKLKLKSIEFGTHEMSLLGTTNGETGKSNLEISHADIGPIKIVGDVQGRFFLRLPGGVYQEFSLGQTDLGYKSGIFDAIMKDAKIEVDRLIDRREVSGRREISISGLKLEGIESRPTFSKRDQKRCGTDRTHIHAQIGLFQFSPNDRRIRVEQIAPHFHLYLRNRLMGGCLKVD